MTYKMLSLCTVMAVIGGGTFAPTSSASAAEHVIVKAVSSEFPTRRVNYADLNLASASDEIVLKHRVNQAVTSVCDESAGSSTDFYPGVVCRSVAWRGAQPQMALAVMRAQQLAATGVSVTAVAEIIVASPK